MAKLINININTIGQVKMDAEGFTGSSCTTATEQIELVLGGEGKKTKKPEYHMPESGNVGNKLTF